MKIIKIIQNHREASEEQIRDFIYRNMSQEMINGLEYDDPKTIERALKLFGIQRKKAELESLLEEQHVQEPESAAG